jgi:hypothetical protein
VKDTVQKRGSRPQGRKVHKEIHRVFSVEI